MDYAFLQQYWWCLVSLLGALLVFLMFIQGGQSLLFTIGKTALEQTMLINALGRKWEFTFTTLVTFGGAFFASFPLFYSTSFGGAYWLWMILLFSFILQAVSYEFRIKKGNILGKKTYEVFLLINGFVGLIFLGIVVSTFFTGSNFVVNKANLANAMMPVISSWTTPLHGLEAVFNPHNLLLGLAVFFLARTLACLYFINCINDEKINTRSRKQLRINVLFFLILFLIYLGWTLSGVGFAVDPVTQKVSAVPAKYFYNLIEMPMVLILLLLGIIALLYGLIKTIYKPAYRKGIWFVGSGTVATVFCLFLIAGLNNTAYYPSVADIQSSLTIYNSSSSFFTLKVMSVVSLILPFVILYIFQAWRAINRTPIDAAEMESPDHKY